MRIAVSALETSGSYVYCVVYAISSCTGGRPEKTPLHGDRHKRQPALEVRELLVQASGDQGICRVEAELVLKARN
jgi:hypothetical protein